MSLSDFSHRRFFEMSQILLQQAKDTQGHYGIISAVQDLHVSIRKADIGVVMTPFDEESEVDLDEEAKEIGRLVGLAWIAREMGEHAQKVQEQLQMLYEDKRKLSVKDDLDEMEIRHLAGINEQIHVLAEPLPYKPIRLTKEQSDKMCQLAREVIREEEP